MKMRACAAVVFLTLVTRAGGASAEPAQGEAPALPTNIRARVGVEIAARLLRDANPDERIRGIQRAVSIGTPEAVALLSQAMDSSPLLRSDARALIELARGFARFTDQDSARTALLQLLKLPTMHATSSSRHRVDEAELVKQSELARQLAAIALARSHDGRSIEQLLDVARSAGNGQNAAIIALTLEPPTEPTFFRREEKAPSESALRMFGRLGDLRALDALHAGARKGDVAVRCAALTSLAALGDARAIALARKALSERDVRLRVAAAEALTTLSAPERFPAVQTLLQDPEATTAGLRLAENVHNAHIVSLLTALARTHPNAGVRLSAIHALGRSPDAKAALALTDPVFFADPERGYAAALALARSPAPNATSLVVGLATGGATAKVGVRAYIVRALVRGDRSDAADGVLETLAASPDGAKRALGIFGRVALGAMDVSGALGDPDSRVRRAAAMATLSRVDARASRALLERLTVERDKTTNQVLAIGFLNAASADQVPTRDFVDRAGSGGPDGPLSALLLMRRASSALDRNADVLLSSTDPVVRAHALRGLAHAPLAAASDRLAHAYAYETDVLVRRAIVDAMLARKGDVSAPSRQSVLESAAQLDPDGPIRQAARLGYSSGNATELPVGTEVAWLRATGTSESTAPYVGAVVRSDGIAVPIAFDEDGFAIVPGLPVGEVRLVLAPRLPTYKAGDQ